MTNTVRSSSDSRGAGAFLCFVLPLYGKQISSSEAAADLLKELSSSVICLGLHAVRVTVNHLV